MAPISTELFFYVCIKHANGGKVDFAAVAKECGMQHNNTNLCTNKHRSNMRWARFKKTLDTSPLSANASSSSDSQKNTTAKSKGTSKKTLKKSPAKKAVTNKTASKKRKLNENEDAGEEEEEEPETEHE